MPIKPRGKKPVSCHAYGTYSSSSSRLAVATTQRVNSGQPALTTLLGGQLSGHSGQLPVKRYGQIAAHRRKPASNHTASIQSWCHQSPLCRLHSSRCNSKYLLHFYCTIRERQFHYKDKVISLLVLHTNNQSINRVGNSQDCSMVRYHCTQSKTVKCGESVSQMPVISYKYINIHTQFWPRFYGSQGLTYYRVRVGNPTNVKFVFCLVSENGENGLGDEGADGGNAPPQNFLG